MGKTIFLPRIIHMLFLAQLALICCCDGECNNEPDLVIPEIITGTWFQNTPYRVIVGNQILAPGSPIIFNNSINEFYSLRRYDANIGNYVNFFWNYHTPPPFQKGAPAPFNLLQIGEEVMVHRCVLNKKLIDFDCFKSASKSRTRLKVVVKVQDGRIVDKQEGIQETPEIPPGQFVIVSFPIKINELGTYELQFEANYGGTVTERNTNNNIYIVRPTQNLGAGQ